MFLGNEAPRFLFDAWKLGFVTDETLRDVIREVWTQAWPSFSLREREWLELFRATGFVSLATPKPTEPLTIYRGAGLSTKGRGMAWSLSREVAEQHAELQSLSGFAAGVFSVRVPPKAVLGMIEEDGEAGGEDEVIVDPDFLRGESTPRLLEEETLRRYASALDIWTRIDGDAATFPELTWDELLKRVAFVSSCADSPIHGESHWRRVAEVGLELVRETSGADARSVLLFAVFHDCLRQSDDDDLEHGGRAAKLVADLPGLAEPLNEEKRRELCEALADHERGLTTTDPTIGCCWDADRLDLGRVGIEPDPELMSTDAGRKRVHAQGRRPVKA